MMRAHYRRCLALLAGLPLAACLGSVNPRPGANEDCEAPGSDQLVERARMLPGWNCHYCHSGHSRHIWTMSGTVFPAGDAPCNSGGPGGVTIDLLDESGNVTLSVTSNNVGNFFSAESFPLPFRARISKDGHVREMPQAQTDGSCNTCHNPSGAAGARLTVD